MYSRMFFCIFFLGFKNTLVLQETTTDFEDESDGEEGGEDTSNTTEEEELNHDTITSLRYLSSSQIFAIAT